MKHSFRFLWNVLLCLCPLVMAHAEDGSDRMENLIYSPRYFGPNAFPMPTLRDGLVSQWYEAELRGEYHAYTGDKTWDLRGRLLLPFFRGRAGVEIDWCFKEKYKMTPETRDERFAAGTEGGKKYSGDVVVSSFFQLLKSKKWADIVISANIKTASGGRLCDARFTDAAAYWFDVNAGRNLWERKDGQAAIRMQALAGFYCWMTNSQRHRQNDAFSYGIGLTGTYKRFVLSSQLIGIRGYEDNGDRPIHWLNRLTYEYKKNVISFRYTHGMRDNLYETYSLGYIRRF